MGLYPYNAHLARKAQTSAKGVTSDLLSIVRVDLGAPVVNDADLIVLSADMQVGEYAIAAQPDVPRNITVTHTQVGGVTDTLGTILITGTDRNGQVITEEITPVNGTIAAGLKAFKTVTSVLGVGWVINTTEDTIVVGVGSLIGLPDTMALSLVLAAYFGGVLEATAPTVAVSETVLASNTIDFASAWDGSQAYVIYLI